MKPLIVSGLFLSALSLLLFVVERMTDFLLANTLARRVCGDDYLREVNGVLTDHACGFDADMQWVALCAFGFLAGLIITLVGIRNARRNRAADTISELW